MKVCTCWFLILSLVLCSLVFFSAERTFAYGYGRVGPGPTYPEDGTITYLAYLKKGGETDNEILTEDNWNSTLGKDQGYQSLYFFIEWENFTNPATEDNDTLVILFTGINAELGNSGFIMDTVNTDVGFQDFGNFTWGASTNPEVPTGLQAIHVSPGVVDLFWDSAKNKLISYRVYRSCLTSGAGNGASNGRYLRIAKDIIETTYRDSTAPLDTCWYILVADDGVNISGHCDEVIPIAGDVTPPEAIDDLAISLEGGPKLNGGDIRLWWSEPYDDIGVVRYVVYRSTSTRSLGDSLAGTVDTTYLDVGAAGDVDTNYVYVVKAVDGAGNKSEESNKVGEYDYDLRTTIGTDYTWIALCLGDSNLIMASDLEAHIEANSFPPADYCYSVSEWNATAQTFHHYTTIPIPMGDFPLKAGHPYRVEMSDDAVWTLTGGMLHPDSLNFQLKTTTSTDYTWISVPLHLNTLNMTSDLEAHIEANSSPTTDCYTITHWNPIGQTYSDYITIPLPIGDFPIKAGRAYRVEVSTDAIWP